MKCLVFVVAVFALVSADEKKPAEEKPRLEEKPHLQWPLPDPVSEGDLLLHGSISYDRVRALHKVKLEDEVDRMILTHGRLFLRRVSKFFDDNAEFKIMPLLCRDMRNLNATNNRWRIEIPKIPQADSKAEVAQNDAPVPVPKEKNEKAEDQPRNVTIPSNETETTTVVLPSSEKPIEIKSTEKPTDKPTDKPIFTTLKPAEIKPEPVPETYEVRRRDFYRDVGANFARLLMKEYRKEALITEESDYLARWIADEAVHYGASAIYCTEGENVKEIKKQLVIFLEEKP